MRKVRKKKQMRGGRERDRKKQMRRGRAYNESKRKILTDERGKRETERNMHTERIT